MAAEHVERIGARIRQRREELKLSRGEVARQMPGKTNENAIYRWEKGLHQASPDALEALAGILDVSTSYFYVDESASEETPDLTGALNGNGNHGDELVLLREEVAALTDKVDRLLTAFGLADDRADLDAMGDRVLAAFAHALEQVAEGEGEERAAG